MLFKRKKADLDYVLCPLCEKRISINFMGKDARRNAFVYHLRHCERYKALLAVSALFQGLRLPKYGGALIKPTEAGFVIEKSLLESAAERFTEFMMRSKKIEQENDKEPILIYDDIPVIRVFRLPEFLMLLGIRIK